MHSLSRRRCWTALLVAVLAASVHVAPVSAGAANRALTSSTLPIAVGSAMNDVGQVVGRTTDSRPVIYNVRTGSSIVVPNVDGKFTQLVGINNRGFAVGFYDNSLERAFAFDIARRQVIRLGALPLPGEDGRSSAVAINDAGQIVGLSDHRSFLYDLGTQKMTDLADEVGLGSFTPVDINERGQVVGLGSADCCSSPKPLLASLSGAVPIEIPVLASGDSFVQPMAINDRGLVVGRSSSDGPDGKERPKAFVFDPAVGTATAVPGLSAFSDASDINNRGLVIGSHGTQPQARTAHYAYEISTGERFALPVNAGNPVGVDAQGLVLGRRVNNPSDPSTSRATTTLIADVAGITAFTQAAYDDFLGRAPTSAEVNYTIGVVSGGTSRSSVVSGLANSPEWLEAIVDRFYRDTLGREPDADGLSYWTGQLRSGRLSVAAVAAHFYAAPEYFAGDGGSDVATWVEDLYTKLLGRPAGDSEVGYWVGEVAGTGRQPVALRFFQTIESRRQRVVQLYDELLGRTPEPSGRDYWAAQVGTKGDIALATSLAASDEYFERARHG